MVVGEAALLVLASHQFAITFEASAQMKKNMTSEVVHSPQADPYFQNVSFFTDPVALSSAIVSRPFPFSPGSS